MTTASRPRLTQARAALTHTVQATDESGQWRSVAMPAERALTIYVDKRELVTLMTLGADPEHLVLGYLRNQRLVSSLSDIASITVDWDVGAAAVKTHHGIHDIEARTAQRVVTTGCGQGTVFGALMDHVAGVQWPPCDEPAGQVRQSTIFGVAERMRLAETTYKSAGSVHGCALFEGDHLLHFVEDVGRHNAMDTLAGWMWMHDLDGQGKLFYTTGRLTSEMVIKSAQMGVPFVVSRSGVTQMGWEVATQLGMTLFGRVINRRYVCYTGHDRLVLDAPAALGDAGQPQAEA